MAHTEKFKRSAAGQLGAHIDRLRGEGHEYGNENIDPERTHLNYDLSGCDTPLSKAVSDAIARAPGRVRKDAVVLLSTTTTLPKNWPSGRDSREFFEAVREFDLKFWPPSYVEVRATVHRDENTDHLHHVGMPLDEDGKFNFNRTYTRAMYRRYHAEMAEYVRGVTHLPDLAIVLPENDPDKALSAVSQSQLDAARAAVTSELESARQEATESAQRAEKAADRANARADKARRSARLLEGESYTSVAKDGTRTNRRGVAGLRKDIAELESRRDELAAEVEALVAEGVSHREELRSAEVEHAARLEGLQRQGDEREGEVAELERQADGAVREVEQLQRAVEGVESVASDVRSFEGESAGRRAEIVARVTARCDRLRADIDAWSDRLRARIDRVESLIDRMRARINRLHDGFSADVTHQRTGSVADGGYTLSGVLQQSTNMADKLGKHNHNTPSREPSL